LRVAQLLIDFAKREENISMICDEDEETAWNCYRLYRRVKELEPNAGKKLASLTFANDVYYPALQAADMLSFLCREQARLQWQGVSYEYQEFFQYLTNERDTSSLEWQVAFKSNKDLKKLEASLARMNPATPPKGSLNIKI
jgi:hypothetical protein